MLINYKIAIIIQLFIILSVLPVSPQNTAESDTIVINSININNGGDGIAAEIIDYKYAANWAYNTGLTLLSDSPPVIDNKGFFIKQFEVEIPVSGYKRDLFYRAYFDFFRYKEKKLPFDSKLKIYVKDIYDNTKLVATADTSCLTGNKLFEVDIPYDLSYPGKFYIVIREYAQKAENWGIWDIIVTSRKITELDGNFIKSLLKNEETKLKISN
ncbi:MAG: hypothetical protein FWF73_07090 [Spirochaetes bacterium]|nr:hypothetical protein [Spirochaetota bacterium]